MSQGEVLKALKENGGWMSREDISKVTGFSTATVGSNANRLLKFNEIRIRKNHRNFNKPINNTNKTTKARISVHEYKIK